MKKALLLTMILMSASFAKAEVEQMVCTSAGNTTVVSTTLKSKGDIDDLDEVELPATASLKIVKFAGKKLNESANLTGVIGASAKGAYYELSGKGVEEFLVAPTASEEPSVLTMNGVRVEMNCN